MSAVTSSFGSSRVAVVAFVAMVAGMIATPLFETGGDERRVLAHAVVASFFVAALASAMRPYGKRALVAAAAIVIVTFLVEVLGSTTGFPFGSYDYTDALEPRLLGVPVIVSFAWAGITLVVHGAFGAAPRASVFRRLARLAIMAGAITAWDAFLDPQMVGEGYWQWQPASPAYRGIPLVNYLGWLLTAGVTSSIALAVCERRDTRDQHRDPHHDQHRDQHRDSHHARAHAAFSRAVYATLAALSTIGFLFFFDDAVVAVVGGGVGGLVTAIRLATAGQNVALFERNDQLGGKLAVRERDGFTFDIGPSLLTLPELFDDVFRLAGTSLEEEIDLVRLDPSFRYFWPDASTVTFRDQPVATAEALDAFSPGSGAEYLDYLHHARAIWSTSQRTFFAGDIGSPMSLLRRVRSPRDFARIDARRSLASRSTKAFRDPRLRQWLGRYATYSGSDPSLAPATLGCIAAVEADLGAWYVRGGLGALRDALVRVAQRCGVVVHTNAEVTRITCTRRRVTGVSVGTREYSSTSVVCNADAQHLYRDLLPHTKRLKSVERTPKSTSGIAVLVGVEGRTPLIAHHNVWFSRDYAREFRDVSEGRIPRDPTIYACVSSITDPTQAPADCENWFLLINTPADERAVTDEVAGWLLDHLATIGPDLRRRARFVEVIGPRDIARRYRSPGGAIYGTSSNGRSAAFRRPAIRGPRRGLYLVGGSTHPGGGLPLVTMSARIASTLVLRDNGQR